MFPDLHFGNADGDKVEARKSQLDTFLKVGIKIMTSAVKLLVVNVTNRFFPAIKPHS